MCVAYVYLWYEWLATLLKDLLPRKPLKLNTACLALMRSLTMLDLKSLRRRHQCGDGYDTATPGDSKLNQAIDAGLGTLLRQPF